MINPKVIAVCAGAGFFLSLLIGLIFGVRFPSLLLRAMLFALVFGALSVALMFVSEKFLSTGGGDFDSPAFAAGSSAAKSSATGSQVNITIDDSALPDEDASPKFTVERNRPSLGANALSESLAAAAESKSAGQGVPPAAPASSGAPQSGNAGSVENPPQGSSGGNSAEPSGFKPASLGEMTKKGGSGDVLDDLPDFGGLAGASGNSSPAAGVSAPPVAPSPSGGGSASTSENAALMAQAIRTVLAKEDG